MKRVFMFLLLVLFSAAAHGSSPQWYEYRSTQGTNWSKNHRPFCESWESAAGKSLGVSRPRPILTAQNHGGSKDPRKDGNGSKLGDKPDLKPKSKYDLRDLGSYREGRGHRHGHKHGPARDNKGGHGHDHDGHGHDHKDGHSHDHAEGRSHDHGHGHGDHGHHGEGHDDEGGHHHHEEEGVYDRRWDVVTLG